MQGFPLVIRNSVSDKLSGNKFKYNSIIDGLRLVAVDNNIKLIMNLNQQMHSFIGCLDRNMIKEINSDETFTLF